MNRVKELDAIRDAESLVEPHQLGAAGEEHVLAVIEEFAGAWIFEACCAATQESASLDKNRVEASVCERCTGCDAGEAASNDDDAPPV
jgi:hypothetical protein